MALPSGQPQFTETMRAAWGPVVDGFDIPDQPRSLFERNAFAAVPVMIGTAGDEGWNVVDRAFPAGLSAEVYRAEVEAEFGSTATPAILEHYPSTGDDLPKSTLARLVGDVEAVCEARRVARLIARSKAPVFLYSLAFGPSAVESAAPSPHGFDLLFASRSADSRAARGRHGDNFLSGKITAYLDEFRRLRQSQHRRARRCGVARLLGSRTRRRPIPRVLLADPPGRRAEYSPGLRLLGAVLPAFRGRSGSGRATLTNGSIGSKVFQGSRGVVLLRFQRCNPNRTMLLEPFGSPGTPWNQFSVILSSSLTLGPRFPAGILPPLGIR